VRRHSSLRSLGTNCPVLQAYSNFDNNDAAPRAMVDVPSWPKASRSSTVAIESTQTRRPATEHWHGCRPLRTGPRVMSIRHDGGSSRALDPIMMSPRRRGRPHHRRPWRAANSVARAYVRASTPARTRSSQPFDRKPRRRKITYWFGISDPADPICWFARSLGFMQNEPCGSVSLIWTV
jgi:hypothetical protein